MKEKQWESLRISSEVMDKLRAYKEQTGIPISAFVEKVINAALEPVHKGESVLAAIAPIMENIILAGKAKESVKNKTSKVMPGGLDKTEKLKWYKENK